MSSAGQFIPLIHGQLADLKRNCGLFHRPLRDLILETENYIQSVNNNHSEQLDYNKVLEPFFKAITTDPKQFQSTVLDCFYKVFQLASGPQFFLSAEITQSIITVLIHTDSQNNDEMNLRCCNVTIACLKSYSGIQFAHGNLLRKMFRLLFHIYNNCDNSSTLSSIEKSIKETLLAVFAAYTQPPRYPETNSITDFAHQVANTIVHDSISIFSFLEPIVRSGYSPTMRDVDMYAVISLLSRIIAKQNYHLKTINLAAELLLLVLQQESKFFETNCFKQLLQTHIHVGILSLCLDIRLPVAEITSQIILTTYQRFASFYLDGLNDILVKGLAVALSSPKKEIVQRSLTIYLTLFHNAQFLVDCYINFDCDESGHFKNVFEDTVDKIVRLSYPDSHQTAIQKQATALLVTLMNELWFYFSHFEVHEIQNHDPEAPQNFLEAKKTKDVFQQGLDTFKKSWKHGLKFFISHDFVEDSPSLIAEFLYNTP